MKIVKEKCVKMALHFTENKSNVCASAIKTPFLIEDILDRNSVKSANKISLKNHNTNAENQNVENNNLSARNSGGDNNNVLNQNDKNDKNNSEMQPNDEEYRRILQNDRYDTIFQSFFFLLSNTVGCQQFCSSFLFIVL